MASTLYFMGVPLSDSEVLSPSHLAILGKAALVIGESRNLTLKRMRDAANQTENVFFLDNMKEPDRRELQESLRQNAKADITAVLFSDTGLPALFDPGGEVVEWALKAGWKIRTASGPASWATACAASLMQPPFLIAGFPPQKTEDRKPFFESLKKASAHVVLLETPYRYTALLSQLREILGDKAKVFLAWELAGPNERLFWGTLGELERYTKEQSLNKGEFILILE